MTRAGLPLGPADLECGGTTVHPPAAMALLGHDVRAALSEVIGGLRLIKAADLPADIGLQMEKVRAAAEDLARLLEGRLEDMSAGQPADGLPPVIILQGALAAIADRWRGRALEKGLVFHVDADPGLPAILRCDRVALDRILSNLVSNAIKFTDRGAVTIRVWADAGARLCFSVTDNGPGLSVTALDDLSGKGAQSRDATIPGIGTGLRVARQLADRIGATLCVSNLTGGGVEALLCLPLPASTVPAGAESDARLDLSHLRLLLAEDRATGQRVITRHLAGFGAQITVASNGIEALERLRAAPFDAAVIDIEMPGDSGLNAIRTLRASDGALAGLPVVAVTAYVLRSNRSAILQAGATAILCKPILGPTMLAHCVLAAIARQASGQTTSGAATIPRSDLKAVLPDDATFRRLLQLAGPGTGRELMNRLGEDLEGVERGLISGIANRDWDRVRAHSHVLVALAGAVGASPLQALAETLNAVAHAQEAIALAPTGARVLTLLDTLIQFIADERTGFAPAPAS